MDCMLCPICHTKAGQFDTGQILHKYTVAYFLCPFCDFVFTETPFWLAEAYDDAINITDTGLVDRNLKLASLTKIVASLFFKSSRPFLDYGGGHGLFVRIMRDAGYDFYWDDKYCENSLAKGFEHEEGGTGYELLTCFELFEHMTEPIADIKKVMALGNSVLFSTMLVSNPPPKPSTWWYYGLEHGQHISFYSLKTLHHIASEFGMHIYSNRRNIHLLTPKKINGMLFRLLTKRYVYPFLGKMITRGSLTKSDQQKLMAKQKK